ncbi:unnamed protein product, partial [Cyprideis torosa]
MQKNHATATEESRITAYIGMGSNVGDGKKTLAQAWQRLCAVPGVVGVCLSSPYLSAPVDMESGNWFTNSAAQVSTSLSARELLMVLQSVETGLGRTRPKEKMGYQDRTIDLDLLYYGTRVRGEGNLILPHPRIAERLFVLMPLAEIAPRHVDPEASVTVE